ncbi:hypothetical protein SAMN05421788_104126 [Filimonas lacunae]|uniref:Uncharacterized protein n=1 Tax=Filimonas lacunae TaxID=477680 RepID=A0A173M9E8_9BACT|nr:hypothetical protein [Filimonas lacunae]BAV04140.1 hypothetical protein FLA_0119 [Filimonas lacunae]SIT15046.1 hypothetical protein SAMN05421788_104126 [Filimonas lacunae]
MSGLRFQIPPTLLAGIYKDTLIASDEAGVATEKNTPVPAKQTPVPVSSPAAALPDTPPEKWVLGGNARGVVVVVNDPDNVYLADDVLQLLTGILNACKLNMADIAVVNYARYPYPFARLQQFLQINSCILFDVSLETMQLPFSIPYNQVQQFNNCTFTYAPALQTMLGASEDAKLQKSRLWLSLKKMFNI